MTLDGLAESSGLGFVFLQDERFDLAIPAARLERAAVQALIELLADPATRAELAALGLVT